MCKLYCMWFKIEYILFPVEEEKYIKKRKKEGQKSVDR